MDEPVSKIALQREADLNELLRRYEGLLIAYSGGVDSTYLADVAHEVLGAHAHLLLADSPSLPRSELAEAKAVAGNRGWDLTVVPTHEFEEQAFLNNDTRRCYYCKATLFDAMKAYAAKHRIPAVAHGENADDAQDGSRVGAVAAEERGVIAPLQAVGLTKNEVRQLSRRRGLPTWNKASFACLATRIPMGTPLDTAELARVEHAEEALKALGFHQYRARTHGDLCRIELEPDDFGKILEPEVRTKILDALQRLGYRHVTLDLEGYPKKG